MSYMPATSEHVSILIDRAAAAVYQFAADPTNLPKWAAGLASSAVQRVDDEWTFDSPMGRVTVEFVPENAFGVLDHVVTLPNGLSVYNPLRVIPDGDGCEVVFTLRRQPGMTDDEFHQDADAVRADLETLKRVLERP